MVGLREGLILWYLSDEGKEGHVKQHEDVVCGLPGLQPFLHRPFLNNIEALGGILWIT